jgi:hypothetical protein
VAPTRASDRYARFNFRIFMLMMKDLPLTRALTLIWALALLCGCELERGQRDDPQAAQSAAPQNSSQPAWADPARLDRGTGEFSVAGIEKVPSKFGQARWLNQGVVQLDSARYHRYRVFIADADELSSATLYLYLRDTAAQGQFLRLSGDYPVASLDALAPPLPERFMRFYIESHDLKGNYQAVPASLGGLIIQHNSAQVLEGSLNVAKAEDTVINYAVAVGASFKATPTNP